VCVAYVHRVTKDDRALPVVLKCLLDILSFPLYVKLGERTHGRLRLSIGNDEDDDNEIDNDNDNDGDDSDGYEEGVHLTRWQRTTGEAALTALYTQKKFDEIGGT
jgi:hypothetical protein